MLIYILILLFASLFIYQMYNYVFNNFNKKIIEGLTDGTTTDPSTSDSTSTFKPYDINNPNNALILAQQNAGNIDVLKRELDQLIALSQEVQDISGNVIILNDQVQSLIQEQADAAQQLAGNTPLEITDSGTPETSTTM